MMRGVVPDVKKILPGVVLCLIMVANIVSFLIGAEQGRSHWYTGKYSKCTTKKYHVVLPGNVLGCRARPYIDKGWKWITSDLEE